MTNVIFTACPSLTDATLACKLYVGSGVTGGSTGGSTGGTTALVLVSLIVIRLAVVATTGPDIPPVLSLITNFSGPSVVWSATIMVLEVPAVEFTVTVPDKLAGLKSDEFIAIFYFNENL